MKRSLLIMFLFTGLLLTAGAQDPPGKERIGSRIEALKIAFLTNKLNLSTEEAQRFWPVYNQYTREIRQVRIEQRQNKSSELDTEENILNIRKKYNAEFTKALNAGKANAFFAAEKDFGTLVQKELMERRELRKSRQ